MEIDFYVWDKLLKLNALFMQYADWFELQTCSPIYILISVNYKQFPPPLPSPSTVNSETIKVKVEHTFARNSLWLIDIHR